MIEKKQFVEHYRNLIGIPSVSAADEKWDMTNRALIDYLSNQFSALNFKITVHAVPDARNKFNMLAQIGSGEGGLLFAGHSDTVPYDEGRWQSDPFQLKEQDNKLYGLGSCDMKGFFAFILHALQQVPLSKLKKPLFVLATADEETSMAGARFFSQQQLIKPDMAIIGEPTELKPIFKHKGHMAHSIQVTGQAGHSSDPEKGVNAIEIMQQAINQLLKLRDDLKKSPLDKSFAVPFSTLNLGHIHGGDGENRICGHCKLTMDVRPLPGLPDQEVVEMIDNALAPVMASYPNRVNREYMYLPTPAFACEDRYGIIDLAEQLTGFSAMSANYSTEAPFIQSLGCDTLVLGPGSIEQAHQPNEFISLDYVEPTTRFLTSMIKHICL